MALTSYVQHWLNPKGSGRAQRIATGGGRNAGFERRRTIDKGYSRPVTLRDFCAEFFVSNAKTSVNSIWIAAPLSLPSRRLRKRNSERCDARRYPYGREFAFGALGALVGLLGDVRARSDENWRHAICA